MIIKFVRESTIFKPGSHDFIPSTSIIRDYGLKFIRLVFFWRRKNRIPHGRRNLNKPPVGPIPEEKVVCATRTGWKGNVRAKETGIMNQESVAQIGNRKWGCAPGLPEVEQAGFNPTLNLVSRTDDTRAVSLVPDRVARRAIELGYVSESEIASMGTDEPGNGLLRWRRIAVAFPEISDALQRLAAETYGFRKILVCEVGTLVYNNLLTRIISPLHWQLFFDEKIVPVLEYGRSPEAQSRLTLGAADPSARSVRDLLHEVPLSPVELVYVPSAQVSELQDLLVSNLNAVHMAVLSVSRKLLREFIDSDDALVPNEIIRRAA